MDVLSLKTTALLLEKLLKKDIIDLSSFPKEELELLKKTDLVKKVSKELGNNKKVRKEIIKSFPDVFQMSPTQLEEFLDITVSERKKWTNDKRLRPYEYKSFNKWGKVIEYPVFSYYDVLNITKKNIESWRLSDKKEKRNKKVSPESKFKAKETREKNKKIKAAHATFYQKMLNDFSFLSDLEGKALLLAYWCSVLNHFTKEFQIKMKHAKSKASLYEKNMDFGYELKNKVIRMLLETGIAEISFYEPDSPDKINHIYLCENHQSELDFERSLGFFVPFLDFYFSNEESINACGGCCVTITKDYYSLYYLKISRNINSEHYEFSFHTPFPIGSSFFPSKDSLVQVKHNEQEGMFRFGRGLTNDEKVIFKFEDVCANIDNLLIDLQKLLKKDLEISY